ncbi:hypothetical protein EI94DRAFT_1697421 [Lactarius quietus]|nr:hypothetical protein EI94DRAFT_1697421 [Lactarius quietus]
MSSTDPSQDYVDDSEPERKRIRLRKAEDKKQRTQKQSPLFDHPPSADVSGGVLIEVSPTFVENSVKEIIGQFRVPLWFLLRRLTYTLGEKSQGHHKQPSTSESSLQTLAKSRHDAPAFARQLVSRSSATDVQEESLEPSLMAGVQRFAYRQVRAKTEPVTTHTERCRPGSEPQVHAKAEKLNQRAKSLPDHDITKLDVGRLLRCVSCEARWTIQKGASNKLSHLVACARKKGINPSTLKTLIVKENLKIQPAKKKDETKTPPDPATAVPQTYMEAVVANAQPKKRQRRQDATTGTLQPISQTKAAILDRAKALLGTMGIVPCDPPEPEATQAFGRSKLAIEHIRMVDTEPLASHLSGESALSSRLDLLRSMAEFPQS